MSNNYFAGFKRKATQAGNAIRTGAAQAATMAQNFKTGFQGGYYTRPYSNYQSSSYAIGRSVGYGAAQVTKFTARVGSAIATGLYNIKGFVIKIAKGIARAVQAPLNATKRMFMSALNAIKTAGRSAWHHARIGAARTGQAIKSKAKSAANWAKTTAKAGAQKIDNMYLMAADKVTKPVKTTGAFGRKLSASAIAKNQAKREATVRLRANRAEVATATLALYGVGAALKSSFTRSSNYEED